MRSWPKDGPTNYTGEEQKEESRMSVTQLERTTSRQSGTLETPALEPQLRPIPRTKPNTTAKPGLRTGATPGVRGKVERIKRKSNRLVGTLLFQTAFFSILFTGAYVSSSLVGHVKVDEARSTEHTARERLKASDAQLSEIAKRIDALSNDDAVAAWAARNHFLAPDQMVAHAGEKQPKA